VAAEIYSVKSLADELLRVARAYLTHFDPGSPLDVSVIRLEISGPALTVIFAQTGLAPPTLTVTMQEITDATPLVPHTEDEKRRWRNRG